MTKKYQKLKKEQNTRKYYKYDKVGHIAKDCKSVQLRALVDSEYTYTGINKQLVKEEKFKTEPID